MYSEPTTDSIPTGALPPPLATAGDGPPCEAIHCEVCVVGGGLAGVCAAISAARTGASTVLLQDRAVLGGNASSEVRMWICGAHGADNKETGILEELQLENLYRNPGMKYALWDGVLYDKVVSQPQLRLLLSSAVVGVTMAHPQRIARVRAWHLTRHCWLDVRAELFVDCSGDAILRYSGAAHRRGREGSAEFAESHAPAVADRRTMGSSILMQLREIDPRCHVPFIAPAWAERYDDTHPRVAAATPRNENFWWMEIGGESDTIDDADRIRDDLLRIAYGVWHYIKNHGDGRGHGWELEWIGMLPGKRESVRYEGDHILTQGDIERAGVFADVIGHGGWSMDDHHPGAFRHPGPPTVFHPAPSPYGIPWRCLYSRTVDNLLFAGRTSSCSHLAMSSTRVMATCAVMGQAVGTAAALAVRHHLTPRQLGESHCWELQNRLMDDDHWLPNRRRTVPLLTREATLSSTHPGAAALRAGWDRRSRWHQAWAGPAGATITYSWAGERRLERVRIVCDSQLHRAKRMPCSIPAPGHHEPMPPTLLRDAELEWWDAPSASWRCALAIRDNRLRLITHMLPQTSSRLRLRIVRSWGGEDCRLFAFELGAPDASARHEILPWPVPVLSAGAPA